MSTGCREWGAEIARRSPKPLRYVAEDAVVDFKGQLDTFADGGSGGHHAHVHLLFAGQADAGNEAGAQVDHAAVDAGHSCVGVKHYWAPVRAWCSTRGAGLPRKTSEGR